MRRILVLCAFCLAGCLGGPGGVEEPVGNRYNSITETVKALIAVGPLNGFGAVPGTISLPGLVTDFSGTAETGVNSDLFEINDIPNILNIGLFANLGDGLAPVQAQQSSPPQYVLSLIGVDAGGSPVGSAIAQITTYYPLSLNHLETQNFFRAFTAPAARALLAQAVAAGATHLKLRLSTQTIELDGYSMDAAWNAATLVVEMQIEVEHTFSMVTP